MPTVNIDRGYINYISNGSGRDIVVIPGFWTNSEWLARYFDLCDIGKIWIFDPPYSNLSSCRTKNTISAYAHSLSRAFDKLGINNPVIIGESMGGATSVALEKIIKANKMILISPAARVNFKLMVTTLFQLMAPYKKVIKTRAQMMFRRKPEMIPQAISMMEGFERRKLLKSIVALGKFDAKQFSPRCPTFILSGRYDRISSPELVQKLASAWNAKLWINEKTGHHVTEYAWPAASLEIREFIES